MRKTALTCVLALLAFTACEKDDQSVAKKAGDKVGETLTDFAKGVGKGIDKGSTASVEVSKELSARGVSTTVAKMSKRNLSVYVVAQKPLRSKLIAKALDKDGLEIGRSVAEVSLGADDAKYVVFAFPEEMDAHLVAKYRIDLRTPR